MTVKDDILTYRELCDREHVQTIQRGMNYRIGADYSVILMSQRANAPYNDSILSDGTSIEYEGHDCPRTALSPNPKALDQPAQTAKGTLTQNGRFVEAVKRHKAGEPAERVRVYEKLFDGIWSYRGMFLLTDFKQKTVVARRVYRFILQLSDDIVPNEDKLKARSRIIPTDVKKAVWARDGGKCVICGAGDELHFDHDLPYSKGGTSITPSNVRILCARHNLAKHDKIE